MLASYYCEALVTSKTLVNLEAIPGRMEVEILKYFLGNHGREVATCSKILRSWSIKNYHYSITS